MSQILKIKTSQQLASDFENSFTDKQKERAHLYQKITEKINKTTGDVFVKRTVQVNIQVDGKMVTEARTFEELEFDSTIMNSIPDWNPKDLAGDIIDYEYIVGDLLWLKIQNYAKLFQLHNRLFQKSLVEDTENLLEEFKSNKENTEEQIKTKEKELNKRLDDVTKATGEVCEQSIICGMVGPIFIEKVKQFQQQQLDKEFKELNQLPKKKPSR